MSENILRQYLFIFIFAIFSLSLSAQQSTHSSETLQQLAERLLNGKQGSIVAIEPKTGRILALVSRDKIGDGVNRAVSTTYSPGSTFKTAQALYLLSCGWLSPEQTYPCHKGFYYNGIHVGCHAHKAPLSLVGAIGQSCNSYFCKAFQEYMDDRSFTLTKWRAINHWARFMHSLGLGVRIAPSLTDEARGIIPDSAYLRNHYRAWNGTTIMWMGMGQGEVKTSPLQLCNLAALIANGGWWITPHFGRDSLDNDSLNIPKPIRHESMATPDAIELVQSGMRLCVTQGTAAAINTPAYRICGKTGTAENKGEDHSAFMGYAPMTNARVAVSVYVENGGFGADLAAPIASLIIEKALTGRLSTSSEAKARRWAKRDVKITPVEVPISFDDL
jgi:penicillin-binding protein 2